MIFQTSLLRQTILPGIIYIRIIRKTEKSLNNTCILYTGRKAKSGYTVVDVRLPRHSLFVPMNVHRLRYMIHTCCIQLNPENYHKIFKYLGKISLNVIINILKQ
jgi:hypothetical protein